MPLASDQLQFSLLYCNSEKEGLLSQALHHRWHTDSVEAALFSCVWHVAGNGVPLDSDQAIQPAVLQN